MIKKMLLVISLLLSSFVYSAEPATNPCPRGVCVKKVKCTGWPCANAVKVEFEESYPKFPIDERSFAIEQFSAVSAFMDSLFQAKNLREWCYLVSGIQDSARVKVCDSSTELWLKKPKQPIVYIMVTWADTKIYTYGLASKYPIVDSPWANIEYNSIAGKVIAIDTFDLVKFFFYKKGL